MSNILNAWASESQAKVCGGFATYRSLTGEVIQVSEICTSKPVGSWDDYRLVGQIDLDDPKALIKPAPHISLDEMLCNLAAHFPEEYKEHYASIHERLVQVAKKDECKYKSGATCTCGCCNPSRSNFNLN